MFNYTLKLCDELVDLFDSGATLAEKEHKIKSSSKSHSPTQKESYFYGSFSLRELVNAVGTKIREHKGYIYIPDLSK